MVTDIIIIVLSLVLIIVPTIVWNKRFGNKYIEPTIMPLRKRYRFLSSFGMMLFMVSCLSLAEFLGLDDINYMWLFLPTMLISNNRTIFEPYHTSEIVDQLDNFCLYLRPFNFYANNKGWATRGNMLIPESIEKLFSEELNKRIAPTYCVGDPNSSMPTTLATSGVYATDEEWKSVVDKMANKSKLILLRVMDTEGCKWELSHCINKHLDKTIFLVAAEEHMKLLKDFLGTLSINIPMVKFLNDGCIALYVDGNTREWSVVILNSVKDIKSIINKYIQSNVLLRDDIKNKHRVSSILTSPFKIKSDISFPHLLSILLQPYWYIFYNKWPILWKTIAIINWIFLTFLFAFAYSEANIIMALIALILLIPWFWLAPKISAVFNSWGSMQLCRKANKELCKWILIFCCLTVVISTITEYFNHIDKPENSIENVDYFTSYVLRDEFEYQDYEPITTSIDSAFNNIYTDEEVRLKVLELFKTEEDELDAQFIESIYSCMQNIDESKFEGWMITHHFAHTDDAGNRIENLCMILTDENFESYFVYSLDNNDKHLNFFEMKEAIDELLNAE